MSTARRNAFVVTKPLQILISLSIMKQEHLHGDTMMVIVDAFANSRSICENLRSLDWDFSEVDYYFVTNIDAAFALVRRSKGLQALYLDSDVGLKRYISLGFLKLYFPTLKIHVYEEGLGTYREDLYGGIKARIFEKIGIGTHFGGCAVTDSIYVCNAEAYYARFPSTRASVHAIELQPETMLKIYREDLAFAFNYREISDTTSLICNVYLTDWTIDGPFADYFCKLEGDNYIKPHPHIKGKCADFGCQTLSPNIPAEMFLIDAMAKYQGVVVYHHGSSAERYVNGNIIFKHVGHDNAYASNNLQLPE